MEAPNRNAPTPGVGHIKKVVSKVIVITPKQIADMGLENQAKNIKVGTVIGQIKKSKSGDGTAAFKPVKPTLLKDLRTKMSNLLSDSSLVMRVEPDKEVDLVCTDVKKEACAAAEAIEVLDDGDSSKRTQVSKPKQKEIGIVSNKVVAYSPSELKMLLDQVNMQSSSLKPNLQSVVLNDNKVLQQQIVSDSSKSENLLCVADLTPVAASQISTISSDSERELTPERKQAPERETLDVSAKRDPINLDVLIAAKKVLKDAAARNTCTVPKNITPSAFRDRQIVRTYSKAQSISVVGGPFLKESQKRVIRIYKKRSKTNSDDEDWVSPKRAYTRQKRSSDVPALHEKDLQLSVEEKVRRIMDECKDKETTEQTTSVAPKKRGRPRKTPLLPKVDIEVESDKDKNDVSEKTEVPTPRKRGRPRKISVEAGKDDKSSDDNSPKKKQRRRKSDVDEKEYTVSSMTSGGIRTSGRKRKVVDYAALSGGRISSSEEEDFAEIERLTGIKHESSEEESEDEVQRGEEEEEDKEKTPTKTEAVHPLKKRLKMEHAQAAEKEKLEDAHEEKKPDEKEVETETKHENKDLKNNTKKAEVSQTDGKTEESTEVTSKQENQNSTHKEEKPKEVVSENSTSKANADGAKTTSDSETNDTSKSDAKEDTIKEADNQEDEESGEDEPERKEEKGDSKGVITCGVCKETLDSESSWVKHKEGRHNNLAWKLGEPALDLENYDLVCKTLTVTLKKYGALVCEVCGQDFSSAIKFIKHARKCKNVRFHYEQGTCLGGSSSKNQDLDKSIIKTIAPQHSLSAKKEKNKGAVKKFSGDVKCAICLEEMSNGKWATHKIMRHNNLAWREGEVPLNLDDNKLVVRILTPLCKQKKLLRCDNCGAKKKSVIGFISHQQQCQKTEEELNSLKVTCSICHRTMLPVSMPAHMDLYHSKKKPEKSKEEETPVVLSRRQAAKKAIDIMQNFWERESSDRDPASLLPKKTRRVVKDVDFTLCDEVTSKFQNDISVLTYVRCVYNNCQYQTENIDDLMEHLSGCGNKIEGTAFTCNYCLATYAYRKDVWRHLETHSNKTDADYIIKETSDDKNFKVEGEEEAIEPLEFLHDDVDCELAPKNLNPSKQNPKFLVSKAQFMSCVVSYKNAWSVFPYAYKWTKDFAVNNYDANKLFDWVDFDNRFKAVPSENVAAYLPKVRRSIDVARMNLTTVRNPIDQNHNWKSYKLFEAEMFSDGSSTIFCGGPVNCLAWVPTPHTKLAEDQILSVSTLPDPRVEYCGNARHLEQSLIQFWNFGPLSNSKPSQLVPKLEFCIAHNYGVITNLEWCPSGCYDANRLGLLAVACGDSLVYIYTVLKPSQIRGKVFECKPLWKLVLSKTVDADFGDVVYFATKTSWTKCAGHKHMAVGYSNGIIGLYSLDKDLSENCVLYPSQSFNAHYEAITALALSHLSGGNRYLLTGSTGKDLKLWDLEDTSDAIYANKKCPVTDLTWNIHWLSPIACYDNVTSMVSSIVPLRDHNGVGSTLVSFNSRATALTSNDWGNLYLNCSDSGEVVAYMADQLNEKYDADKKKRRPRFLLSYTGIVSKKWTPEENKSVQTNKMNQMKSKKVTVDNFTGFGPRNYKEAKDNYGLIFCDIDSSKRGQEGPSINHNKLIGNANYYSAHKPDTFPVQSITKAVLNQNAQSFHYYALGYQIGFVRVSKIGFLNK